jgi:hypothetical protein
MQQWYRFLKGNKKVKKKTLKGENPDLWISRDLVHTHPLSQSYIAYSTKM